MKKINFTQHCLPIPILLLCSVLLFTGCPDNGSTPDDQRARLTAGPAVYVNADATEAVATFTGAAGLELGEADFELSGAGASMTDVDVDGDTVSVTVGFSANTDEGGRSYTVSVNPSSSKIRGNVSVTITHYGTAGASGSIAMRLVNQTGSNAQNTPNNAAFITLNKVTGEDKWLWSGSSMTITSTGSPGIQAGGTAEDTGIMQGTLLYADIVPQSGFTLEAKMRIISNTNNTTGVITGVIGNAEGFAAISNFKGFSGIVHRAPSFRHMHPFDAAGGIGIHVGGRNMSDGVDAGLFTYRYTVAGDGSDRTQYSGRIIRGGSLEDVTGDATGGDAGRELSATFIEADRFPGIIVYDATVEITEISLTITAPELRTILTPGTVTPVSSATTEVEVTYTGDAAELAALTLDESDFSIPDGATIDDVDVDDDTVTVTITLTGYNMTTAPQTFILSTNSDVIVASNVTITRNARRTLTAGSGVPVDAEDVTANVTFTGVQGLTTADIEGDFVIVSGDATITDVTVNDDTVTIKVNFTAITAGDDSRTFVIGINSDSIHIMGSDTVTITQGDTRTWLEAGAAVSAAASDTSAVATFTNATGLTLTDADFSVTDGGTIGIVTVTGDTANVQVTFAANTDITSTKTYIVSINPASTVVVGIATATVTITQAAAPITMRLVSQAAVLEGTTADNNSFLALELTGTPNQYRWVAPGDAPGTPMTISSKGGDSQLPAQTKPTGITQGTLLYADIPLTGNFTLVARIRLSNNTSNNTGVGVGSFADVAGFKQNPDYVSLVALYNRAPQVRRIWPATYLQAPEGFETGNEILRGLANPNVTSVLDEIDTYTFTVNNATAHNGYSFHFNTSSPGTIGPADEVVGLNRFFNAETQRYPGIFVYSADIEIYEITLTITP